MKVQHYKHQVFAYTLSLASVFGMAMSSCEQKELCYDHNHAYNLNVSFDWRQSPDASPGSMLVCLFPRDSAERTLRREFAGSAGGKTQLPVNITYDALFFNSDIRNAIFSNTSRLETFTVSSRTAATLDGIGASAYSVPRANGTETERMAEEADKIWGGCNADGILLTLEQSEHCSAYDITLYPQRMFCTYSVKIANVENIENITPNISATLSGMAGGRYISSNEKIGEKVTVVFPIGIDSQTQSIIGSMYNFGNSTVGDTPNKLVIYTTLTDGSKWYYVYDVTDQIRTAPDPYNVEIQLDTLPIPNKMHGGSGMNPGVNDWNKIDVPITM